VIASAPLFDRPPPRQVRAPRPDECRGCWWLGWEQLRALKAQALKQARRGRPANVEKLLFKQGVYISGRVLERHVNEHLGLSWRDL
jgi:hypothetical protein